MTTNQFDKKYRLSEDNKHLLEVIGHHTRAINIVIYEIVVKGNIPHPNYSQHTKGSSKKLITNRPKITKSAKLLSISPSVKPAGAHPLSSVQSGYEFYRDQIVD